MPRVDDELAGRVRIPGLYRRLLERERDRVRTRDPRWSVSPAAKRGEPCPPEWLHRSPYLADLEAGRPVTVPVWRLGGHSEPDQRIRRLSREDRSIRGWIVHPDDTVTPTGET